MYVCVKIKDVCCYSVLVGDRWTMNHLRPHLDNCAIVWYDTHLMMSLVYGGLCNESTTRFAPAEHLIKVSMEIFVTIFVKEILTALRTVHTNMHTPTCGVVSVSYY